MVLFHRRKGPHDGVFNGAKARTADFFPGDIALIPKTLGHYIENTGDTDLVFLEMFKASRFEDLALSEWIRHAPPELMMGHLGISANALGQNTGKRKPS